MVKTRSALLKEQLGVPPAPKKDTKEARSEILETRKLFPSTHKLEGSVKTEPAKRASSSRKNSTSSSFEARKKMLELKAAEDKAKIEMTLIEKKLAADLAALEDECSRGSKGSVSSLRTCNSRVNHWLEQSPVPETDAAAALVPEKDNEIVISQVQKFINNAKDINSAKELNSDKNKYSAKNKVTYHPQPDAPFAGIGFQSHRGFGDGNQMFATTAPPRNRNLDYEKALQPATVSPKVGVEDLLSRLATSKDLPLYFGDPLDWLNFKQSYLESTRMCKYNDTENMWRLRKCLRGDAKEAVSSLLMSGVGPDMVMETLELQFGRPESVINKIVYQIKKLQPLPPTYHNQIVSFSVKIRNYATAARMSDATYLNSPELVNTILSKLPGALITKWADYMHENRSAAVPKMEMMASFLFGEATKTAAAGLSNIHVSSASTDIIGGARRKFPAHQHHAVLVSTENECKFCHKTSHALENCPVFKRAMKRDRWRFVKTQKLCYQCLTKNHGKEIGNCAGKPCDECNLPHHKLLHWKKSTTSTTTNESPQQDESGVEIQEVSINNTIIPTSSVVLLKMVHVYITGPNGTFSTHALLDDGATITLVSNDLAEKCGLRGVQQVMKMKGAWNTGEIECQTEIVNFTISATLKSEKYQIRGRKIQELDLPTQKAIDISNYEHLKNVKDCLSFDRREIKPQLLIGQDNYTLFAPIEIIVGKKNEPHATHTPLGWCVHGPICTTCDVTSAGARCVNDKSAGKILHTVMMNHPASGCDDVACNLKQKDDLLLHELVRNYFNLESIGVSTTPRENKFDKKAQETLDETIKYVNGQWEIGLPWKNDTKLEKSYYTAEKRLKSVEKKILLDDEFGSRYRERVAHLFANNYARPVEESESESAEREWFLPHFGVDNPKKKKLRLVFDAAAKSHGKSLNDYLLQGPDLLQSLLGIMLRFREKPVGVAGDIKDMFLRIKIRNEDQKALQFLWRENQADPIRKYAMTSLIFGANCSPFIAQYVKNKNAEKYISEMPDAVSAIHTSHYMDDYIESHDSPASATKTMQDVTYIHSQAGFEIRNWVSNCKQVLTAMPKETLSNDAVWFKINDHAERTLGMLWYPATDTFGFDLALSNVPSEVLDCTRRPTKREVLRIVMSIFDIFGLLAPFIVTAKIIIQQLWKTSTKWDDPIPITIMTSFTEWISQLKDINKLRIPRWYFGPKTESSDSNVSSCLQLHIFCDASPAAYCAVAYWRLVTGNEVRVVFIVSKCRVAPLKPVSIPRLELQGGLLACRLAQTIQAEHRIEATERYFWTDSTTVLHWIRDEGRNYKVFIANRLGEIDTLSNIKEWHYVPTQINIADAATKKNTYQMTEDCDWFRGPEFLRRSPEHWPREPETKNIEEKILEKSHPVCHIQSDPLYIPTPEAARFSSWLKLLRCTARMLLFIKKCRKQLTSTMNSELLSEAEVLLIRRAQSESFQTELNSLKQQSELDKKSKLLTLTPFIDGKGLLRVGGRINAVKGVNQEVKTPVILDGRSHLARLIVKHYHERAAHANNETVVNELRQRYWVIRLRPTVRSVASRCLSCRIRRIAPSPPRMGDLPEARMMHHRRPFTSCGLDLFGPVEIAVARRREKRYGVIFTCLTVRAVHIEIVPSLTADSLIMAIRRMASRRGWPRFLFSDNGTNMRGADNELRRSMLEVDQERLREYGLNNGMEWRFVPPLSPHMAGCWERLIRSIKTALKVTLKERAPREEVLMTLLAEVENIVNSRPLTHVSVDPADDEALTPNHFLLGTSSALPILGAFDDHDLRLRKYWRTAQRLTEMFWRRWLKEVLPALVPRQKWTREGKQLREGDLVLITDPNTPRNAWPRGRVAKVHPGPDGRVRVVEIKTKTGTMTRPAVRVAPFPAVDEDDECCKDSTRVEDVDDAT